MKKSFFLILFIGITSAFSQTDASLKIGNDIKNVDVIPGNIENLISYDEDGIIFTTHGMIGKIMNGKVVKYHVADKQYKKSAQEVKTIIHNDKIIQLFIQDCQLKKDIFSKEDLKRLESISLLKDYTIRDKKTSFEYKVVESENKNFYAVLLTILSQKQEISSIHVLILDKELNLLHDHSIESDITDRKVFFRKFNNITIDDNGTALLCTTVQSGGNDAIRILAINDIIEEIDPINIDGKLIDHIAQFDKNGNIVVAGYLKEKESSSTFFTFSFSIDNQRKVSPVESLIFPADYDITYQYSTKKEYNLLMKADKIIFFDDNTIFLLGHEYLIVILEQEGFVSTIETLMQYARDVVVTKISKNLTPESHSIIGASCMDFLSEAQNVNYFKPAIANDNLYIIFHDSKENYRTNQYQHIVLHRVWDMDAACGIATITPNNELTKKILYINKKNHTGMFLMKSLIFDEKNNSFKGFYIGDMGLMRNHKNIKIAEAFIE